MTHGSLFSGIGGFDAAAEAVGWHNVFHCEKNPFCQTVLKYYWPNATDYEDITNTDFAVHRGAIDVLTGGFPCQPFSLSGKRRGTADERNLWPAMLRCIRQIKPRWVVGENVLGIISWDKGLVFEQVQADLEAESYEVKAYVLPVAGKDGLHLRYRTWFVVHAPQHGLSNRCSATKPIEQQSPQRWVQQFAGSDWQGLDTHTTGKGQQRHKWKEPKIACSAQFGWQHMPTEPPICKPTDGVFARLSAETIFSGVNRTRKTPFKRWREESIKALGNAICPLIAKELFESINAYETLITNGQ